MHSQESILIVDVIVLEMVDGGTHLKYGNGRKGQNVRLRTLVLCED